MRRAGASMAGSSTRPWSSSSAAAKPSGLLNISDAQRDMYNHGLATFVLGQAHGMTTGKDRKLNRVLDSALKLIANTQCEDGGWDYRAQRQHNGHDLSLAVMQAKALRSAVDSGLEVPPEVIDLAIQSVREHYACKGGRNLPESEQQKLPGQFTYSKGGGGGTIAMAAAGVVCLQEFGQYDDWRIAKNMEVIQAAIREAARGPQTATARMPFDAYTLYYVGQALYQVNGEYWKDNYPQAARLSGRFAGHRRRATRRPTARGAITAPAAAAASAARTASCTPPASPASSWRSRIATCRSCRKARSKAFEDCTKTARMAGATDAMGSTHVPSLHRLAIRRRRERSAPRGRSSFICSTAGGISVVQWAAMDFLREAMQRNRRILQIRDIVLLVLRTAAVLLFGLALARPFFATPAGRVRRPPAAARGDRRRQQPEHGLRVARRHAARQGQGPRPPADRQAARRQPDFDHSGLRLARRLQPRSVRHEGERRSRRSTRSRSSIARPARAGGERGASGPAKRRRSWPSGSSSSATSRAELAGPAQRRRLKDLPPMQVVDVAPAEWENTWISDLRVQDGLADVETPTTIVVELAASRASRRAATCK